jgi:hypothetical protein
MKTPKTINCLRFFLIFAGFSCFYPVEGTVKITPALNTETTAQAGDEILKQADYYEREAIPLN